MFKRKRHQFPRVDPTLLKDTAGLDSLRALPTEELRAALASAGHVEGWALSVVRGLEKTSPDDAMIEPFTVAAMHSRIARECMAIELVLREERKEGGPPDSNGKPGPKSKPPGYL